MEWRREVSLKSKYTGVDAELGEGIAKPSETVVPATQRQPEEWGEPDALAAGAAVLKGSLRPRPIRLPTAPRAR